MKNNPNSATQVSKFQIPTFDSLYNNKLSGAVDKFKALRRRIYFSSISAVSGIVIVGSVLYMILRWSGVQKTENSIGIWIGLSIFTTLFLLLHNETKNRNYYNELLIIIYIALNIIGFILFYSLNVIEGHSISLFIYSLMVAMSIGLMVFIGSGVLSDYEGIYRRTLLDEMIKHMGVNMRFTHEGKIDSREFLDSKIINIYKRNYKAWDLVELEYGTQQFKFCNVRVSTDSSSPKDNFMGVFLVADINQNLTGITKIANRDDTKTAAFLKDLVSVDRLAIQTNYPELEKYLKVSTTRPQEADELLTPAFVRRLLRFCKKINLTSIPDAPMLLRLHFKQQKLYMTFKFGIDDLSLFQIPKPIGSIDEKNTVRVNYARLKIILEWIEDLHLTDTEWASK